MRPISVVVTEVPHESSLHMRAVWLCFVDKSQLIRELRTTVYRPRMSILGSRNQYCVHKDGKCTFCVCVFFIRVCCRANEYCSLFFCSVQINVKERRLQGPAGQQQLQLLQESSTSSISPKV